MSGEHASEHLIAAHAEIFSERPDYSSFSLTADISWYYKLNFPVSVLGVITIQISEKALIGIGR